MIFKIGEIELIECNSRESEPILRSIMLNFLNLRLSMLLSVMLLKSMYALLVFIAEYRKYPSANSFVDNLTKNNGNEKYLLEENNNIRYEFECDISSQM